MTIVGKADVRDRKAFREGLVSRTELVEKAKFITSYLGWDSTPGFSETESPRDGGGGGCEAAVPLPDECVVVLLYGQMQLDDDERVLTGTNVAVRTRGSKTLRILANSAAVWYPGICCWDADDCYLATKGQCKRLGIGIVREEGKTDKKKGEKKTEKTAMKSPWNWVKRMSWGRADKNS
ncbi:uncharacterized protein F4812DRAFT_324893 [Daldinia caldariorum]|uniref:uncharacterized protein n=1 Tax=Daldinia caldariorum TaxID=326644 RepID=UPI0020079866|nr:uncharacterized protein F4812DRAFT_324893 [Daldinia caldariorum]KAI1469301.1 hypothetical protein F4812DRAFT_324893 [Daldinia caldariorum]